MRHRLRGITQLGGLVFLAASAAGCSDSPVFGDASINDTSWRVVSLAEEDLSSVDVTMGLDDPTLGTTTLYTPCRSVAIPFAFDTDGEAVSFGDPGLAVEPCSMSDLTVDQRASAALAAAETWHLIDDMTIEMRSADGAALLQMTLMSVGS